MPRLPVAKARDFIRFLETLGFQRLRQRGSHLRLRASDGRMTTVPVHGNRPLPKGLLRAIVKNDLEISLEEFIVLWERYKGR